MDYSLIPVRGHDIESIKKSEHQERGLPYSITSHPGMFIVTEIRYYGLIHHELIKEAPVDHVAIKIAKMNDEILKSNASLQNEVTSLRNQVDTLIKILNT
jgi:hypothetical protein